MAQRPWPGTACAGGRATGALPVISADAVIDFAQVFADEGIAVHVGASLGSVHKLAHTRAPYFTMAEGLKLAAQSYTRDVSRLSCCAS